MHRRSFRLLSGGYYNQDEEFDPNISYRENPYKVFKTRTRKPSHTSRRANRNASSSSMDTPVTESQSDGFLSRPSRTQSQPIMRTVPFVSHRVTPQPALTPSSSQSQKKAKAAKSEVKTTLANAVGLRRSSRMKKAYLLLFILLLPSVWFFLPSLTSFTSSTNVTKTPTQGQLKIEPVVPAPVQNQLTPELLQAMKKWLTDHIKEADALSLSSITEFGRPMADKMVDFALVTQGASVIRTRCSETYRIPRLYVTLFGFTLLSVTESPSTVIQGNPVLSGQCWPFNGAQGTLAISLSHPIMITHVTLDHLPRYNSPSGNINSAPKDFEIYGMKNISERGTLLGTGTYDEHGEPTQTFDLPNPSDELYTAVELRVLSNWGNVKYTCLYRFRVHGKIASP